MRQKLLLVISLLCMHLGSAQTFKVDYIEYTVTGESTVSLTNGSGSPKVFNIPSAVNYNSKTYTVTSIGQNAFRGQTGLEGVTVPNTVTTIGDWAFYICAGLTSVSLPDSLTSIGIGAFMNCTKITTVNLSDLITVIQPYTFSNCNKLASIELPSSLTLIQQNAFSGCASLESVVIPDKVTTIEYSVFDYCESLSKIVIPASVTSISWGVFNKTALTAIICDIPTPLITAYSIFQSVDLSKCTLEVPASSVDAYKTAKEWGTIGTIAAKGTLNTDTFVSQKLILYPNPFSNEMFLELNDGNKAQIEVLDLNGKVLLRKTADNSTHKFDTGNLASGMYLVKISSENNTSVKKMIKK